MIGCTLNSNWVRSQETPYTQWIDNFGPYFCKPTFINNYFWLESCAAVREAVRCFLGLALSEDIAADEEAEGEEEDEVDDSLSSSLSTSSLASFSFSFSLEVSFTSFPSFPCCFPILYYYDHPSFFCNPFLVLSPCFTVLLPLVFVLDFALGGHRAFKRCFERASIGSGF